LLTGDNDSIFWCYREDLMKQMYKSHIIVSGTYLMFVKEVKKKFHVSKVSSTITS
jgi:hypothetical protein